MSCTGSIRFMQCVQQSRRETWWKSSLQEDPWAGCQLQYGKANDEERVATGTLKVMWDFLAIPIAGCWDRSDRWLALVTISSSSGIHISHKTSASLRRAIRQGEDKVEGGAVKETSVCFLLLAAFYCNSSEKKELTAINVMKDPIHPKLNNTGKKAPRIWSIDSSSVAGRRAHQKHQQP